MQPKQLQILVKKLMMNNNRYYNSILRLGSFAIILLIYYYILGIVNTKGTYDFNIRYTFKLGLFLFFSLLIVLLSSLRINKPLGLVKLCGLSFIIFSTVIVIIGFPFSLGLYFNNLKNNIPIHLFLLLVASQLLPSLVSKHGK
jgi:hypothetical protein